MLITFLILSITLVPLLSLSQYPLPTPTTHSDILSNWMGYFSEFIGPQTISQLSLAGLHDQVTYDLSTVVSDGGIDDSAILSWVLHFYSEEHPEGWIVTQAQTQITNLTNHLNNGIRFLDFRTMFTSDDWYGIHFMQTYTKSMIFLSQVKQWIDAHPSEVIVIWISKHGSPCKVGNEQYPDVPLVIKQTYWAKIRALFGPTLVDFSKHSLNSTTISTLVSENQRVLIFASDYKEMTSSSDYALNACLIDNKLPNVDIPLSQQELSTWFQNSSAIKAQDAKSGKFFLLSMANSPPALSMLDSVLIHFDPNRNPGIEEQCAKEYHIPGMNYYCPFSLMETSQLLNYYRQIIFDKAHKNNWSFPNAIYLNSLDGNLDDGSIRTGSRPLTLHDNEMNCIVYYWTECQPHDIHNCIAGYSESSRVSKENVFTFNGTQLPKCSIPNQVHHQCCRNPIKNWDTASYAYVDTLIYSNVWNQCQRQPSTHCQPVLAEIEGYIQRHPLQTWNDPETGRLVQWP